MGLMGWPLLIAVVLLAIGGPVACLYVWNRVKGRLAVTVRLFMIVMCQVFALFVGGVSLNHYFEFYASWSDLFGGGKGEGTPIEQVGAGGVGGGPARFERTPKLDPDVYTATITGEHSGVRSRILVWVPPGYGSPANAHQTYPVVELLPGYPGTPSTWFHAVHGAAALKEAITAGRAHPFILVAPVTTVVHGRDTECVDFPGGPRVETWLTDDVRQAVTRAFRVQPDRSGWGLMGFSTGGYCAAKMAIRRPDLFSAAVTMQGDAVPQTPEVRRDHALFAQNSVLDLLRAHRPPVSLLLAGTRQDRNSDQAINQIMPLVKPPTAAFLYVLPKGGHNASVWNSMLPQAYAWLSGRLSAPHPA
ncbi:alpha/beta hydrolase-fold protein [Actinoallomurus liliacearum]|uniref:Alpha/beta hydrolase-fold protein n=1 Tax=Actinoallomurus liliacearum TaxID=1080073 RepID=A0ABP8TFL0_9ACTN